MKKIKWYWWALIALLLTGTFAVLDYFYWRIIFHPAGNYTVIKGKKYFVGDIIPNQGTITKVTKGGAGQSDELDINTGTVVVKVKLPGA